MTITAAGEAEHLLRDADAHCLLPMAARDEAETRSRPPSTSMARASSSPTSTAGSIST